MLYTEVLGRPVVSTSTALAVGSVSSLVIDPAVQRAVALSLARTPGGATLLPWPAIAAFGADAITVPADDVLVLDDRLAALDAKEHAILNKRVLTTEGYEVGTVGDVEFDPRDGRIVSLLLKSYRWDGGLLVGVGSYAVIVRPQQIRPPEQLTGGG